MKPLINNHTNKRSAYVQISQHPCYVATESQRREDPRTILGETFLVVNWVWKEHTFIVRGQTVHAVRMLRPVYIKLGRTQA